MDRKEKRKQEAEAKERWFKKNSERFKNIKLNNDRKMAEAIKKFNLYIDFFYPEKTNNQKKCMKTKLKKDINNNHFSFNTILFRTCCEYIGEIKYDISDFDSYSYDANNNFIRRIIDRIYRNTDIGGDFYSSERSAMFKKKLKENKNLNDTDRRMLFLDYCYKKFMN